MRTVSLRSPPGADGRGQPRWAWDDIELAVHHLAFSFDSQWFAAVCDRGGIWFNQRGRGDWVYLSTGTHRVSFGYFSADGTRFVATDASGRALIVELGADIFGATSSRRRAGV